MQRVRSNLKPSGAALLVLAVLQMACGAMPSLWGTASTPTPFSNTAPSTADPAALPSQAADPPSWPLIPTVTPTAITSFVTPQSPATTTGPIPTGAPVGPTSDLPQIIYTSQSGDTLEGVARRFGAAPSEIRSDKQLPAKGLIDPETVLVIPDRLPQAMTPNIELMPDVEVINSATSVGFEVKDYVEEAGGFLASRREYVGSTGWTWGYEIIDRVASENSISPRLLLAVLEYESRWVRGAPVDTLHQDYAMGYQDFRYKGLIPQMVWAVNQLSIGYYGWRTGTVTELNFRDGTSLRIDPRLNAGTVALQYLFSKLHSQTQWAQIIDEKTGFPALYSEMFGDPWSRAARLGPIFPAKFALPELELPFEPGAEWSYTGGPHGAWEHDGSLAAIDLAPATDHSGCSVTDTWVTAAAQGMVVRSGRGVVDIDMDDDGFEQTGWNLIYLHIATKDRIAEGTFVQPGERLGHASCEGGISTGTHLHFARKFNGEWVAADGPLPMILGGWSVIAGARPYEGKLVKGDKTIIADPVGQAWSVIFRESNVVSTPAGP